MAFILFLSQNVDGAIFAEFKKYWPNEGGYCDKGVKWWLSGSSIGGGGYFKDVFTDESSNIFELLAPGGRMPRKKFNEFITQALESERALTWYNMERGYHSTTIFGAKYDSDGWIRTIYYSDNNHYTYSTVTRESTGIIEAPIIYFDPTVQLPQQDLETNPDYQKDPDMAIKLQKYNHMICVEMFGKNTSIADKKVKYL